MKYKVKVREVAVFTKWVEIEAEDQDHAEEYALTEACQCDAMDFDHVENREIVELREIK